MDVTLRKLMIVPWAGPLPDWYEHWCQSAADVGHGWDFLVDTDEESIYSRIARLGVLPPLFTGRKLCDYRPAFGMMYEEELAGYDFWGHTDLDCRYGPLHEYVTDELLADADAYSNDYSAMCGPFSLYRTSVVISQFTFIPGWREKMADHDYHVLDEGQAWIDVLSRSVRVVHGHFEGPDSMYVHFNRTKAWPE